MTQTDEGGKEVVETVTKAASTSCGFGPFRPHFLQCLANPIAFLIIMCMYSVMEGAIASGKLVAIAKTCIVIATLYL